jgi:outer membrane receptor protein involved in Fe transport
MDLPPQSAEIIVTGTALPAPPGAAAYSGVTIGRNRLTGTASGRIEDVLKDVAGLAAFRRTDSRTANPTSQGVTLRAIGGNASSRALVLLDGVPIADPFAGYIPWSAIDPAGLASIRVTRGGGAGAFGVGAVAGTLELASAGPADLAPVTLAMAGGSRGSFEASGLVAARLGGGFVTASGRFDRGDGFLIVPANQRGAIDIPARYRSWGGSLRFVMPVAADSELQVSGRAYDDRRVRGLELANSTSKGADASVRFIRRGGDGMNEGWGVEALAFVQARGFSGGFAGVAAGRATATPALEQYNTPATGIGGKIELRPPVGSRHNVQIGIDARHGEGATRERFRFQAGAFTRLRDAGGATATFGGYIEDSWRASEALTLTAGVRADRWQIETGQINESDATTGAATLALATPARAGWRGSARGGAVWEPVATVALRSAAYTGFRVPTPNELYRPFRVGADATAANPALGLERARGVEAGFDWRPLPVARLSITGFANQLRGAVSNVTLGTGPGVFPQVGFVATGGAFRQRLNLDAVVVRGVEGDASLTLGGFEGLASVAWADPRVRASGAGAALDGLRPANTPQLSASATLGWSGAAFAGHALRSAVTLRHVAAQFDDDQNRRRLPPATTVDASARLGIGRGFMLEARAENIGDVQVVSGISANGLIDRAQPRTLWLGLRWEG